jgi:predicted enzyme related to lactoylglutathione lyase
MTAVTTYRPGAPCWVDLASTDPAGARTFYTGLFGWEADPGPAGAYTLARLGGTPVAGLNGAPAPPGMGTTWTLYLAGEADPAAERMTAAGGRLLLAPIDAGGLGRVAVATDPGGALIGVWEGATLPGAGLVDEPGAPTWYELVSADLDAGRAFYAHVFGLRFGDGTFDLGDGQPLGAVREGEASTWGVWFAVADADEAAADTERLGGTVEEGPAGSSLGRLARLRDPQGGAFTVLAR